MPTRAETDRPRSREPEAASESPAPEGRARPSHVATSVVVKGELVANGDLSVDGNVEGKIVLEGHDLVVGPTARIVAEIQARTVTVHGTVVGNITVDDRIEITPSGSVRGDLRAPRIALADGSSFRGRIDMHAARRRASG